MVRRNIFVHVIAKLRHGRRRWLFLNHDQVKVEGQIILFNNFLNIKISQDLIYAFLATLV